MSHVNDLRLEDLPDVEPYLINKLRRAGILSVLDLAASIPNELAEGGGDYYDSENNTAAITADIETISQLVGKAKKALVDSGALNKEFCTAEEFLEKRNNLVRFTTGSVNLDAFLKGGIESQAITEIAGEFGSGKSQLCHTLCVTAAANNCNKEKRGKLGGGTVVGNLSRNNNNNIIFVDTENTFRPERIHQIAEGRGLEPEEIMKRVSPQGIAIDPATGKVYVTNGYSNTTSVINGTTDKVMRNVTVDKSPSGIAIDPDTQKVYVANSGSDTVSVINGTTDRTVANIRFSISPINSGHIKCDKKDIATNHYHLMESYTQCTADANNGFQFSSWTENLGRNSIRTISTATLSNSPINSLLSALGFPPKDNAAIFNVNQFGNFTANFKEVPPPIPPEYWIPLYGVIVSSIVGWSIPSIIGGIKAKRQGGKVLRFHQRINYLYRDGKLDQEDIEALDDLKSDITDAYAKGKISEQHYRNLKNEISILYEEIYNKMITLLSDKSNKDNDRLMNNLRNDITDAYAKGKISEQHYSLLNKKISDYQNNHDSIDKKLSSQKMATTSTIQGSPIKTNK